MKRRRISVVGNSGSGKSTAAVLIGEALGIEHLELDSVRHQPNWVELGDGEFIERVVEFMDTHESWVIDGNYSMVRPEIWSRADTVIWLDPPRLETARNVVFRTLRRLVLREELWNGNRERLRNALSLNPEKSVIAWSLSRHDTIRQRYSAAASDPDWQHLEFVRLRKRRELKDWIERI